MKHMGIYKTLCQQGLFFVYKESDIDIYSFILIRSAITELINGNIRKKIKRNIRSISSEVLNGENYSRSDFARSLLNYPAMMVPSVQEPIIEELSDVLNNEVSLLDPFMGASNTLVTGMKYGMNVFGQDINPLSLLLSQVKTTYYLKE